MGELPQHGHMICKKCNHQYPDEMAVCPICGEPRPEDGDDAAEEPQQQQSAEAESVRGAGTTFISGSPTGSGSSGQSRQQQTRWSSNPPAPIPAPQQGKSGTTPLVLGILSLLLPYVGIVLGILAVVFGSSAKKTNPMGTADYALGHAGWILGIIGLCFQAFLVIYVAIVFSMVMDIVQYAGSYASYGGGGFNPAFFFN